MSSSAMVEVVSGVNYCPDVATLKATHSNVSTLASMIFITETGRFYTWSGASSATADDLNVIKPTNIGGGTGRWVTQDITPSVTPAAAPGRPAYTDEILAWPFDDAYGSTTWVEHMTGGAGYDMTVSAGTLVSAIGTGPYSKGVFMPDSTQQLKGGGTHVPSGTAATMSIWVKPKAPQNNGNYGGVFHKQWADGAWGDPFMSFGIYYVTNGFNAYICRAGVSSAYALLPEAALVAPIDKLFLALTYDGTTLKGYVNGELTLSQGAAGSLDFSGGGHWMIGQNGNGTQRYPGIYWDARVWSRVLSATEILNHWKTGTGFSK